MKTQRNSYAKQNVSCTAATPSSREKVDLWGGAQQNKPQRQGGAMPVARPNYPLEGFTEHARGNSLLPLAPIQAQLAEKTDAVNPHAER